MTPVIAVTPRRPLTLPFAVIVIAAVAVAAASAPLEPAAAQSRTNIRVIEFAKTGNWAVRAVYNFNRFDHCAATARYRDGTSVSILARSSGVWTLGFRHPSWPDRTGQQFPASLLVDGRTVLTGRGNFNGRSAIIDLGTSVERVVAIMRGTKMTVVSPSGRSSFSLLGTRNAATETARCWTAQRTSGQTAGSGAGAFGGNGGGSNGAFTAPAPAPSGATRLSRAETMELAARYLSSAKQPYEILPEAGNILKSYPVNWRYRNGVVGGMMAFKGRTGQAEEIMGKLLATRAANCKGRHAIERLPGQTNGDMMVSKAVSACAVGGTIVKQVLSTARFSSGALLIILEAKADTVRGAPSPSSPRAGVPLPGPVGPGGPKAPAPNEL